MADTPDDPSEPSETSETVDAADEGGRETEASGREESSADAPPTDDEATDEPGDTGTSTDANDEQPADETPLSDSADSLSELSASDSDTVDDPADTPEDAEDEPTGGLRRVDDEAGPPEGNPSEDADDVGLPGPSMDTQPTDEPQTTAESDNVAEHVADAPYGGEVEPAENGAAEEAAVEAEEEPAGDSIDPEPISADAEPIMGGSEDSPVDEYAAEEYAGAEHPPDPDPIRPDGAESPAPTAEPQMAANAGTATGSSFMDAPPDDEEMPLTEHIEEMVLRLSAIAFAAATVATAVFVFAGVDSAIQNLWYHIHPGTPNPCVQTPTTPFKQCAAPHVYGPLEYLLTKVKLSGLVGLLVALPVGVYQTYLFMRPGLYPKERRYYLASVPMSLVLALVGVAFATFVILPLLFEYFLTYSADTVSIAFRLEDTINLMLVMMAWLAVIFQIPLLMMLGVLIGVTSRRWMASRRIYFWGGFGGVAFLFSAFDPTGVAPILLTLTMIVLFEVTLLLLRWVGR
jgi:sec-independent protein translocase protein TatC